jgi:hypothetical protein
MRRPTGISALLPGACVALFVSCGKNGEAPPTPARTVVDASGPSVSEEDASSEAAPVAEAGFATDGTFGPNLDAAGGCSGNQPSCPCTTEGKTVACWTGPANERNFGACHDGTTKCEQNGEFAAWGPCMGEQLVCIQDSGAPPPSEAAPPPEAGPPPQSCLPGASLSALITGPNVTTYVPVGSWSETGTGILVVPVEGGGFDGTGAPTTIATPNVVNTCGGNSLTGEVVCTSNTTDVYLIKGTTIATTLKSAANTSESFSGGGCETCNVAIDPAHNQAYLSIGYGAGGAFQPLDLTSNTLGAPIPADVRGTSEALLVDTMRGYVLSPNEQSDYQLLNTMTGQVFDFSFSGASLDFDSPGEDCLTGIALATDEAQGRLLLVDLTQATFGLSFSSPDASPVPTWTAPNYVQPVPEFSSFSAGTDGIAVAPNSHIGVVTGEFGGNSFGAIVLPSTSGTGTPALVDWVAANVPPTPDSMPWTMGKDPHTLTAYTSPANGAQYAIFEDDAGGASSSRSYLAVVDLLALLARPRTASTTTLSHTLATPLGASDTCVGTPGSLVPNPRGCIVRFIKV